MPGRARECTSDLGRPKEGFDAGYHLHARQPGSRGDRRQASRRPARGRGTQLRAGRPRLPRGARPPRSARVRRPADEEHRDEAPLMGAVKSLVLAAEEGDATAAATLRRLSATETLAAFAATFGGTLDAGHYQVGEEECRDCQGDGYYTEFYGPGREHM